VGVFASPAATLITPERWLPVTGPNQQALDFTADPVPQGDTLTVVEATPAAAWSAVVDPLPPGPAQDDPWAGGVLLPWSFLAVQRPLDLAEPWPDPRAGLPPGPPYFDWDEYRAFLRGPGVAWRNSHAVVAVGQTAPLTLAFLLAGTPDRGRRFDFEVVQRLPAKTAVTLNVPAALAAKVRQRRPWLGNDAGKLRLPQRPRVGLGRIFLAAGVAARAAFSVTPAANELLRGHSLAIRQLWRGEEVGRITWWFVEPPASGNQVQ
jgi:hypothetical protein